jgi:hypothetical protein
LKVTLFPILISFWSHKYGDPWKTREQHYQFNYERQRNHIYRKFL